MKIAFVSTYRCACGVGIYLEELAESMSKIADVKVFAEKLIPPQVENIPLNPNSKVNYERCWLRGEGYDILRQKILEFKPDICHIQFVAGVFGSLDYKVDSPFQKFCKVLRDNGIKIAMTLHDIPQHMPSSNELTNWYKALEAKYFVMNIEMSAGLREWSQELDINLIPLGTPVFEPIDKLEARKKLSLNPDSFIMTQIGFYGVDKGMLGIVKAIPNINIPNFKLAFAGGFHPLASPVHKPHVMECIKFAVQNKITNKLIFLNKIISEEEINLWASASDFLILNQEMVFGSSSSASAHRILCSGKPIIMSQSPKLSEFLNNIHCVKTAPENIAETVNSLYNNKALQERISTNAAKYGKETSFDVIAQKHMEVYKR